MSRKLRTLSNQTLKLADYPPVHTHKPYNNLHFRRKYSMIQLRHENSIYVEFNSLSPRIVCCSLLQQVWTKIRPEKTSGLIWIQSVWPSKNFTKKLILKKKNQWTTKNMKISQPCLYFWKYVGTNLNISRDMRFPTMWYVRLAKAQTSLRISAVWSAPLLVARISYDCVLSYWLNIIWSF